MTLLADLLAALDSDDPNRRQRAAMQLGTVDAGPAMPELAERMAREPDDFVRETLVWAVVANPEAATPALLSLLDAGPAVPLEPVLHALSKMGDPSTVAAIEAHVDDQDPVVAAKAWWALGRISTPEAVAALVRRLGTDSTEIPRNLTRALVQAGPAGVPALEAVLGEGDATRRAHAAEVLTSLLDPDQYDTAARRRGDAGSAAREALLRSTAGEVDEALLLASGDEARPLLARAADELRRERAR